MPDDPFWHAVTSRGAIPSATFDAFLRGDSVQFYEGALERKVQNDG